MRKFGVQRGSLMGEIYSGGVGNLFQSEPVALRSGSIAGRRDRRGGTQTPVQKRGARQQTNKK